MPSTLKSTKVKVNDVEKVREILDSYECQGVEIHLREDGAAWTLEMAYLESIYDLWQWPAALRLEQLPGEEQYPDEDDLYEAESDLFDEKGEEGFLALLRELAEHLQSPLLILAATVSFVDDHAYWSQVWRVRPGTTEIETLEV